MVNSYSLKDTNPRILIVDDDDFVRINLVAYLEDEGMAAFSATCGEDALDILKKSAVDVAVVDIRLPGMDGNTFMLKAREIVPDLRFIVHTGSIDYSIPESLGDDGLDFCRVFQKPISDMSRLHRAILYCMKG